MEVYGHRGAAGEAPENTIAACRHALNRGAKFLEVDLRISADDQVVVIHDDNLQRTTGHSARVRDLTASQLAKLDAREVGPPWPRKRDAGIPTLDRLLDATNRAEGYQLEVKPDSQGRIRRIAEDLAERFDTPAKARGVVIISSDYHLHEVLMDLAPDLERGMVATRLDAFTRAQDYDCAMYCAHWSNCVPMLVRRLHKQGVRICAWTVNDAQAIRNLHRMGVDCVTTDYPSMAVPLVAELERK